MPTTIAKNKTIYADIECEVTEMTGALEQEMIDKCPARKYWLLRLTPEQRFDGLVETIELYLERRGKIAKGKD